MKNKLLFLFLIVPFLNSAMDNISSADRKELKDRITQINFAFNQGPMWFGFDSRDGAIKMQRFIQDQVSIIEKILDKNSIPHPQSKTRGWLQDLERELNRAPQASESAPEETYDNNEVDISGLDKVDVLQALLESAGVVENDRLKLDKFLKTYDFDVDYYSTKPLKVNLSGNSFNAYLFNRDNGNGAAQRAIQRLKGRHSKI